MTHIYSFVCIYRFDVNCFLLRSRASDGVHRRFDLNLHKSVNVLYEKTSFTCVLIVNRHLIVVPEMSSKNLRLGHKLGYKLFRAPVRKREHDGSGEECLALSVINPS